MPAAEEIHLRGAIVLGPDVASFAGATARVYLEDVSRADASARVVARQVIEGVSHQAGATSSLGFELRGGDLDTRAHYSVRAHIAPGGETDLRAGAYVSTRSYPVLTFGHPRQVTVEVSEIR